MSSVARKLLRKAETKVSVDWRLRSISARAVGEGEGGRRKIYRKKKY